MKIVKFKAVLLWSTLFLCAAVLPAAAQAPVTVPPAAMPATTSAADAAPVVMPAAQMPVAAAPTPTPADMQMPTPMPTTTAVAPIAAPVMPSTAPIAAASSAAVTTPPPGMPTGTPAVVTQVMSNLQDSKSNVSVEDLSKAQDALTRLDLLLQIEKKIGEIKKTQDDRESGGAGNGMGGGMMGQIPASALVLPGQMNGQPGMPGGMAGGMPGGMPGMNSPVISSAPAVTNSNYEIEQISGTNGNYSAVLTTPDGDRKTVRAGDKLDGRRVESISFDSVRLAAAGSKTSKKGGKTLTIHNETTLLTPLAR